MKIRNVETGEILEVSETAARDAVESGMYAVVPERERSEEREIRTPPKDSAPFIDWESMSLADVARKAKESRRERKAIWF